MLDKISKFGNIISVILMMISFIFVLIPVGIFVPLIVVALSLLFFMGVKDKMDKNEKKMSFIVFLIQGYFFFVSFITVLANNMKDIFPSKKFPVGLYIMLCFILALLYLVGLYKSKDSLKTFLEKPFAAAVGKEERKPGDIIICKNAETGKDAIIPLNDRFLHMLILGATGTGKTSQIILPMIRQDMANKDVGITVIEPKGDLAIQIMALAKLSDRSYFYFNPTDEDCPTFNPLEGDETQVIENMSTTFSMLNTGSSSYFEGMNDTFIRNLVKAVKRLKGNQAVWTDLVTLAFNVNGEGEKMISQLLLPREGESTDRQEENKEVYSWFKEQYYNDKAPKTFQNTEAMRNTIFKINSNKYLRKILNPKDGKSDIDFEKILRDGDVLAITTNQGKLGQELSRYLGYFIILTYQSAVFNRPGTPDTRRPHFLYIDEFQVYANAGFENMLTQGRSYRVASHLATQNRSLIGGNAGRDAKKFIDTVSTNARNLILFPGCSGEDAAYYSREFGEVEETEVQSSFSKPRWAIFSTQGTETFREVTTKKARFSISDLIYKPTKYIAYRIIRYNSIQFPELGMVDYIPYDLKLEIDRLSEEHELKSENAEETSVEIQEKPKDLFLDSEDMKEKLRLEESIDDTEKVVEEEKEEMEIIQEEVEEPQLIEVDSL